MSDDLFGWKHKVRSEGGSKFELQDHRFAKPPVAARESHKDDDHCQFDARDAAAITLAAFALVLGHLRVPFQGHPARRHRRMVSLV
jgi:hypothetical protein